jgi:protein TonB
VSVAFVVQRNGSISGVRVAGSSGSAALDKAATDAVKRLGRFKPIPKALARSSWSMRVPIQFQLR